jgi:hypothetical protein
VRDHIKAIFAKVGVTSRGELVAKLFAEFYAPVHTAGVTRARRGVIGDVARSGNVRSPLERRSSDRSSR